MPIDRGVYPGQWALPGGGVEPGEQLEEALRREIREELGVSLTSARPLFFTDRLREKTFPGGERRLIYMVFLLYECTVADDPIKLSDEFTEYAWVVPSLLLEYDLNEATRQTFTRMGLISASLIAQEPVTKPIQQYITQPPAYQDYDPQAAIIAQLLSETIRAVGPQLRVEHVGSSSVPGCGGKGYLDLMIIYPSGQLDLAKSVVHELGFQRQEGRDPFPEERPMRVGSVEHGGRQYLIHAHVISCDSAEVDVMLDFREALQSDPALVRAYEEEKRMILEQGVLDGADYAEKKSKFVEKTLAQRHDQAKKN